MVFSPLDPNITGSIATFDELTGDKKNVFFPCFRCSSSRWVFFCALICEFALNDSFVKLILLLQICPVFFVFVFVFLSKVIFNCFGFTITGDNEKRQHLQYDINYLLFRYVVFFAIGKTDERKKNQHTL